MSLRPFVQLALALGWIPIVWGFWRYAVVGGFSGPDWVPVMLMQTLVLAIGVAGAWLSASALLSQKSKEPSPRFIDMRWTFGLGLAMLGGLGGMEWLDSAFPKETLMLYQVKGSLLFSTSTIGYLTQFAVLYRGRPKNDDIKASL